MASFTSYPSGEEIGTELAENIDDAVEALPTLGRKLRKDEEEEFIAGLTDLEESERKGLTRLRDLLTKAIDGE